MYIIDLYIFLIDLAYDMLMCHKQQRAAVFCPKSVIA